MAHAAQSYGLSRYALEMMVRVLELLPLSAALFAALRAGMAFDAGAMDLAIRRSRLRHLLHILSIPSYSERAPPG